MLNTRFFLLTARFYIIITALIMVSSLAIAQGGWATADYTLLLALHPRMAWYDFSAQRFYRSSIALNNPIELENLRKKAAAVTSEMKSSVDKINRDRNRILKDMNDLEASHKTTVNAMLKDNKDVTAISKSFELKRARLEREFAEKEKEYNKVREAGLDVFYLPKDESNRYLFSIMTEIDQILKRLSRERGNVAIVDRSFVTPPAQTFEPPTGIPGFGLLGSQLYAQLLQTDYRPPQGSNDPNTTPEHMQRVVSGVEGRFQEDFEKGLTQIPALQPVIANVRPRLVLAGGEDLTLIVLQDIFNMNRVSQEVEQRILRILSQMQ